MYVPSFSAPRTERVLVLALAHRRLSCLRLRRSWTRLRAPF